MKKINTTNKNTLCIYQHIRLDTNEVFYVGIGYIVRSKSKNHRNKHWLNIVKNTEYEIQVLKTKITWEEAVELEKILISWYGRRDLNTGSLVNLTDGGEGSYGRVTTIETRLKMSEILKGKSIGDKNPFYGRKHTDKTKLKLRNYRLNTTVPLLCKKIINTETGYIWESLTICAKDLNRTPGTIWYHLSKENNKFNIRYYE